MKPEPITVKRRRRQAWGKYEKKEETVLGTLLVSLICFQIFCISRKNRYAEGNDDDDEIPTRSTPGQAQVCTVSCIDTAFPLKPDDRGKCCVNTINYCNISPRKPCLFNLYPVRNMVYR